MNIIILGAGQVGAALAQFLARDNNITVVDTDADCLQKLQDHIDIRTVRGHAAYPSVLEEAGAEDADMLIAVTPNDEVNLLACQIAKILYKTTDKIARIRRSEYITHPELFDPEFSTDAIAINTVISPELLVMRYIEQLIRYPGALQVLDFADGRVRMVALKVHKEGIMYGQTIRDVVAKLSVNQEIRIVAIYRNNAAVALNGDTIFKEGDEIFFLAQTDAILRILKKLQRLNAPYKKIFIVGGGNIGLRLAKALEKDFRVKILEQDLKRCRELAEELDETIVLHGNAMDKALLMEENIDETDLVIGVTNHDEANILACMFAKQLGARKIMTLVNNSDYVNLIQDDKIDIAISADQITISSLLAKVRRGSTAIAHTLRRGAAEAIEVVIHGNDNNSLVINKTLEEIAWPQGTVVGAIVRESGEVIMAHHDLRIESMDHVVLFVSDRNQISAVEQLITPKKTPIR
jgi:trk system potassium uptake protein TrkA